MKTIRKLLVNPSVRINRDSLSFLKQKDVFNKLIREKLSLYNLETLSKTRKSIINYLMIILPWYLKLNIEEFEKKD